MNELSAPTTGYVSKLAEEKPLGVLEQLQLKKSRLQDQMTEIDVAIELFKKHPEFEQCLTQLSRVGIYR